MQSWYYIFKCHYISVAYRMKFLSVLITWDVASIIHVMLYCMTRILFKIFQKKKHE